MIDPKSDKVSKDLSQNGTDVSADTDAPSKEGMTRREAMSVVTKYSAVAAPMILTLFPGNAQAGYNHYRKTRRTYGSGCNNPS